MKAQLCTYNLRIRFLSSIYCEVLRKYFTNQKRYSLLPQLCRKKLLKIIED